MIYFTSDNHFGHTNIIKHTHRPFSDAAEMDRIMIDRWNAVVKPDDIVYHMGDFTLKGKNFAQAIFSQLNGTIYVLGNFRHHDRNWINHGLAYNGKCFTTPYKTKSDSVYIIDALYKLNISKAITVILCHFPIEEWDKKFYNSIHLHGHSHGNSRVIKNRYDVGVDLYDFYPVSLSTIVKNGVK